MKRSRKSSRSIGFGSGALILAGLLVTRVASATDTAPDPERARALFKEGRQLAAEAKYQEACPKFEESLRLDAGIGTEFNLADCFERVGRTASAHTLFAHVTEAATRSGQTDRAVLARGRAAVLEPKLARLLIRTDAPAGDIELSRNGKPIEKAIGQPFAVDPGLQDIEVRSPGKRTWSVRLDVAATAGTVSVIVPKLEDQEEKPRPTPSADAPEAAPPKRVAQADAKQSDIAAAGADLVSGPPIASEGGDPTLRKAVFVFGGVGVAALAAGAWMLLEYRSSNQAAGDVCPSSRNCTGAQIDEHARLLDEARSARTWAYVGLGAGGAALIGATVAYLRGRPHAGSAPGSDVAAAPVVTAGAVGIGLRGSW